MLTEEQMHDVYGGVLDKLSGRRELTGAPQTPRSARSWHDEIWLLIEREVPHYVDRPAGDLGKLTSLIKVAKAPGGAYSFIGGMHFEDDSLIVKVKTVKAIIWRRWDDATEHKFPLASPDLFDAVNDFLDQVAKNAMRTMNIEYRRSSNKWRISAADRAQP